MRRAVRFARLAAIGGLTLALAGCINTNRSQSGQMDTECPWEPDASVRSNVTIAWQPIPNGDLLVQDHGILEACMPNASITWKQFSSGSDVVQAMATGDIDIGLMGSSPTTTALSPPNSMPIKVVWIADVIGGAESLVAADPKVADITDLKGQVIATPFGSTAHYSLLQALDDAGMPPSDVRIVNLEPENMLAVWGQDIDAAWVWHPALADLEAKGGRIVLTAEDTAKAGKPTFDLIAARTGFMNSDPEFMRHWTRAQNWAVERIRSHPDEAAESMAILIGAESVSDAKRLIPGYTYLDAGEQASQTYLGGKMGDYLNTTAEFLVEQASIDSAIGQDKYSGAVDASWAKGVADE